MVCSRLRLLSSHFWPLLPLEAAQCPLRSRAVNVVSWGVWGIECSLSPMSVELEVPWTLLGWYPGVELSHLYLWCPIDVRPPKAGASRARSQCFVLESSLIQPRQRSERVKVCSQRRKCPKQGRKAGGLEKVFSKVPIVVWLLPVLTMATGRVMSWTEL